MAHLPALHAVRQSRILDPCCAFQLGKVASSISTTHSAASAAGTVYVYDHGSSPPLQGVLADHIAAGRVKHVWWDPGNFTSRVTR
jgi:hypothetical protein